jgi:hypothetical protein
MNHCKQSKTKQKQTKNKSHFGEVCVQFDRIPTSSLGSRLMDRQTDVHIRKYTIPEPC